MIVLTDRGDGTFALTLKLPPALVKEFGPTVYFDDVTFPYGADAIRGALERNAAARAENARCIKLGGKDAMRERGETVHEIAGGSIAWRLKFRDDALYAYVAINSEHDEIAEAPGAIGVDFNDGFLAVAEIDGEGNAARRGLQRIDIGLFGGAATQRRDAMAKAVRQLVDRAIAANKPIIIENLRVCRSSTCSERGHHRSALRCVPTGCRRSCWR